MMYTAPVRAEVPKTRLLSVTVDMNLPEPEGQPELAHAPSTDAEILHDLMQEAAQEPRPALVCVRWPQWNAPESPFEKALLSFSARSRLHGIAGFGVAQVVLCLMRVVDMVTWGDAAYESTWLTLSYCALGLNSIASGVFCFLFWNRACSNAGTVCNAAQITALTTSFALGYHAFERLAQDQAPP